jgi:hypothetical protein
MLMFRLRLVLLCLLSSLIKNNASATELVTGSNDPVLYMLCFADEDDARTALIEQMGERALAWRTLNPSTPILCIHNSCNDNVPASKHNIEYKNFENMIAAAQGALKLQLNEQGLQDVSYKYEALLPFICFMNGRFSQEKANIHFRCDAARTVLAFWHMAFFPNRGMMYVDLSIQEVAIPPLFTKYHEDLERGGIVFASGFINETSDVFYKKNAQEIEKNGLR